MKYSRPFLLAQVKKLPAETILIHFTGTAGVWRGAQQR